MNSSINASNIIIDNQDNKIILSDEGGFSEDKFSYKNYIDKKVFLEETILFQKRLEEQC